MAKGQRVLAAGEMKTKGGDLVYINDKSGHYRPHGELPGRIAEYVFGREGFNAKGKYVVEWGRD